MLQAMRDHLTGWVAIVLFVIIGLAFAVWGIDYQFTGNTAAAEVNGEEVPLDQMRRAYRAQLNQYQQFYDTVPPELDAQIRTQVVDGMVRDEVMSQFTRRQGYRVGDQALTESVRSMQEFQDQGRFSADLYRTRLSLQGMSPQMFEARMRRALRVGQLQQAIAQTAFVTDAERRRRAALERQEREAAWAVFAVADLRDQIEVDDEQVANYYEENATRFMTDESVDISYVELSLDALAAGVDLIEADVRDHYQAEVDAGRFQAPHERRARHILFAVDADNDEDAARAAAEAVLARLEAGEDFAALATEHSDDPGSAPEGGDLGWAQRNAYVGAFADALFSMGENEVQGPVRTEFGYHILRMEGQRGGIAKPFAEVQAELEQELRLRTAENEYYDLAERLADQAFEFPDSLEPAATDLGLEVQRLDGLVRGGGAVGLAAAPAVVESAFSDRVLVERENSDVVEVDAQRRVVLRVEDYHPARRQPLEEVRAGIVQTLRDLAARERAQQAAEQLAARVRAGEDFATVAAEAGASFNAAAAHRRDTGNLAPALRTALFNAPRPRGDGVVVDSVTLGNGDAAVFQLADVRAVDVDTLPDGETLRSQSGYADLAAFIAELRDDAEIVVRLDQLQ